MGVVLFRVSSPLALPESISGSIRVDYADGDYQQTDRSTLNQRYNLSWSRRMFPYLNLRTSFSYDRVGTQTGDADETWREQIRPTAELAWSHPHFLANASVSRWESNSADRTTSLIRETLNLRLSTRSFDYPVMSLRLEGTNSYNAFDRSDRDTREHLYDLSVSHNLSNHRLMYEATIHESDIRSSDVKVTDISHQFRWDQSSNPFTDRMRLSSEYRFAYREEETRFGGAVTTYYEMPVVAALALLDPTPELSTLDTVPALIDGNTDVAVFPEINLGESVENWNLGADLGFPQTVNGMYVYMDRPSGSGVTWTIYTSEDNVSWERVDGLVESIFNTSFNRYEILFSGVETRYIKAVAGGLNSVVTSLVTEMTPLGEELTERTETRRQSSHQASAVLSYQFSKALQSVADVLVRYEPTGTFTSSRDHIFYGFSTRHAPSDLFEQSIRWKAGYEDYSVGGVDQSNSSLTYSATARPLQTLDFTFAASNRQSFTDDLKDVESNSAALRTEAVVLPKLVMSADVGYTRTELPRTGRDIDTWSLGSQANTALLRSLETEISYLYQRNEESGRDMLRERHQISVDARIRLTRAIQLRGTSSWLRDEDRLSIRHDYTALWQLGQKMSVSGHGSYDEGSSGAISRRWSAYYTYRVNRRTTFNTSYTVLESNDGTNTDSRTLQFGIRTHF
ncbi:MAG: hypothetical protein Kow0074_03050 [Candidatus Zixiibacteriota bacterium]